MSHMKRLLDENPHGICEAYIVSQETALNSMKDQNQELIDALEMALRMMEGEGLDEQFDGEAEVIRAAISKARGEVTNG